ncbi:Barrier-to-autointegration factor B [Lamellibrachia satsuma]|nr:Barrier-to-autointegration factor B [Lamellibrachia satsuma]
MGKNKNNNSSKETERPRKRQRVRQQVPLDETEMRNDYSANFSCCQYIPSAKYDAFIAERMGDKDVVALPGIAETFRLRLIKKHGIEKAYELLGQFLVLKKNKLLFSYWITSTIDIKDEKARECYNCLLDWSDIFL